MKFYLNGFSKVYSWVNFLMGILAILTNILPSKCFSDLISSSFSVYAGWLYSSFNLKIEGMLLFFFFLKL